MKEQNRSLEQMQGGMGATDNLLASTLTKMKVLESMELSCEIADESFR